MFLITICLCICMLTHSLVIMRPKPHMYMYYCPGTFRTRPYCFISSVICLATLSPFL